MKSSDRTAISTTIAVVFVVLLIAVAAVAFALIRPSSNSSTVTVTTTSTSVSTAPTSSTSSSSITSKYNGPSELTWETHLNYLYLDPHVAYYSLDYGITQNVYEPILWFNGSCSTCVIPWLAQSYTTSSDLTTYSFTLRQGIKFADGEPLNSSSVFFSLNRFLVMDGSTPVGHGTQGAFIVQPLLNTSLSTSNCCAQTYSSNYVDRVLGENFVAITGPYTFTIHVMHPNAAFPFLISGQWSDILAPGYIMQQDIGLWSQSSLGYTLPYPKPSGTMMDMIKQYLYDEASTCNAGNTPKGCAATYLDHSYGGSLGGSGPYSIHSVDKSTQNIVLTANPNYWGGPNSQKIHPTIQTININYVPNLSTREINLISAAKTGTPLISDIPATNLYDVASRSAWLNNHVLQPVIPGTNLYGPYTIFYTQYYPYATNVTDAYTGKLQTFQPFADIRFRLAFSDSVDLNAINQDVNNGMGIPATSIVPPGLPPQGVYNTSVTPRYSYNPNEAAKLLLDAMMHPKTGFTYVNGTAAKAGVFDNTFGCSSLNSAGTCTSAVPRSVTLVYATGDTVNEAVVNAIAGTINNISSTYNMGLTANVAALPFAQIITQCLSAHCYMYFIDWYDDYPWIMDYLQPFFNPTGIFPAGDNMVFSEFTPLINEAVAANMKGDLATLLKVSAEVNSLANQNVMYLYTLYTAQFVPTTSVIHGFSYNSAEIYYYYATMSLG